MANYWVNITTLTNYRIDRDRDFTVAGFRERLKRMVNSVHVGDMLVYYIKGVHRFGAIATVTSAPRIEKTRIWAEENELWPLRLDTKPDLVLPDDKMLDVKPMVRLFTFVSKRQRETSWGMAFRGSLKKLPKADFDLIEKQMRQRIGSESVQPETPHEALKSQIREIGRVLGKVAETEHKSSPYVYDVVWREAEGLNPSHVFEVQDKGDPDKALAKLQHARDIWRSRLCLVVTGEKDRHKVESLLNPFWDGSYHRIAKHTLVLTPEVVADIYGLFSRYDEIIRHFCQE